MKYNKYFLFQTHLNGYISNKKLILSKIAKQIFWKQMLWGKNFQWVPAKLCGHNFEKKIRETVLR